MSTLFISDLHLDPSHPQLTRLFLDFLNSQTQHVSALYILGDLFEVWIGDDALANYPEVINALQKLVQSGVATYFMPGNRDFLVGRSFAETTGCILLPDPSVIDLYGTPTLLVHGDNLCSADHMHQIFRAITRMQWLQKLYLKQPYARRLAIAQKLRLVSKNRTHNISMVKMDAVDSAILQLLQKYQVQHMIHGHTHRPSIEFFNMNEQPVERIVLSDWDSQGNALVCQPDGGKRLVYFGL